MNYLCHILTRLPLGLCLAMLLLLLLLLGLGAPAIARQDPKTAPPAEAKQALDDEAIGQLHEQAVECYAKGETQKALSLWVQILESDPKDTVALYNSACAVTRLGFKKEAFKLLDLAVQFGFVNFEHLKSDPDLEPLHDDPRYAELLASVEKRYAEAAQYMEKWARETLGAGAIIERDDDLRLVIASNLDRETFDRMKGTITTQMRMQIATIFDGAPNSYVLVLVPTPEKADQLIGSVRIGGFYDHDTRRLVLRDIGPSLRHELTHALDHAQMDRLSQNHPMWIQEGVASMFEMYDIDKDGHYRVLDNTRLNVALNLKRGAALTKWRVFFNEPDNEFNRVRARAKYAEARAIFQFLAEKGLFEQWYRLYLDTNSEDASGALAFERLFDQPLEEVERGFRIWLGTKEKVPEVVRWSQPSIGVWIADQAANDGVQVLDVNPGGAARAAGIRGGDVITAIDGHPMYAVEEVVADILRRGDGEEITLRLRHGLKYRDVKLILRPIREGRRTRDIVEPGTSA